MAFFQIHLGSNTVEELHVANGLFRAAASEFDISIFRLIGEFDSHSGLLKRGVFCILAHGNQSDRRYAAKLGDRTTLPIMNFIPEGKVLVHASVLLIVSLDCWAVGYRLIQFFLSSDMCV